MIKKKSTQTVEEQYSEIIPELITLAGLSEKSGEIDPELYSRYDVKRGLRDLNGKGVLAGLTQISRITAKKLVDGQEVPDTGRLYYRGREITDLVRGFSSENRFGFEEIAYLLLFGDLPDKVQLQSFSDILSSYRNSLPNHFVRDIIMTAPSDDMMNVLARSVLTLYSYDTMADDLSLPNVLRQCLQLIAMLPLISVYGYQTYQHYYNGKSLIIRQPDEKLSFAENILSILRKGGKYTDLEAKLLDICLVLHMEHGGGNNSSFTTHVVTSSGTDTYSVFAAALGSLKGPRHGGANIKVVHMMDDLKAHVKDWTDDEEILLRLGSQSGDPEGIRQISERGKASREGVRTLPCGRTARARGDRGAVQDVQGRQRQRRLLLRLCLSDAGASDRALYADLRHRQIRGLERPPHGGAHQPRQDHPPGL